MDEWMDGSTLPQLRREDAEGERMARMNDKVDHWGERWMRLTMKQGLEHGSLLKRVNQDGVIFF